MKLNSFFSFGLVAILATGCSGTSGVTSSIPSSPESTSRPVSEAVATSFVHEDSSSSSSNFSDNFSFDTVGSSPNNWSSSAGSWKVCEFGSVRALCSSSTSSTIAPSSFSTSSTNYTVETNLVHGSAAGVVGILGRYHDLQHFYGFALHSSSTNGVENLQIWRHNGSTITSLGSPRLSVTGSQAVDFKVVFSGSTFTTYVNGSKVSTISDSTFPSGGFALHTSGTSSAVFENVTATGGTVTNSPTPSPVPTNHPTTAPTNTPTISPVVTSGANEMAGCSMYTNDPRITRDITNAAVASNSASAVASESSFGHLNSLGRGAYALHVLANANSPTTSFTQQKSYHTFPGPFPVGQFTNQNALTNGSGDKAMEIIGHGYNSYSNSGCKVFDGFNVTYIGTPGQYSSSNMWSAYSACFSNPDQNMVSETCNSNASLSGLEIAAGLFPEQLNKVSGWSGINHALLFEDPCTSGALCENSTKMRLHASYPDPNPATNPQGAAIVYAMKHYGVINSDNGCCFNIARNYAPQSGDSDANYADINSVITKMSISDFDLLASNN